MTHRKTRRILTAAAAVTVAALGLAGCSSTSGESSSSDPIRFGVSGPLTGDQAQYGEDWQEGFELAIEQINADGGVNGRQVEIDFQDSQGEAAQATTIAQKFVADESILAVLGDFSSATSMVASPIYQDGGLVQLGITNSHPDFTDTGDYIFSPSVTQENDARTLENGARELGDKQAVFYLNTDWGSTAFEIYQDEADTNGDDIVFSTAVDETSTDFRTQLIQARDAGADVITLITYYQTSSLIVQQAKTTGLEDTPVVAVGSNYSSEFLDLAGDDAEGVQIPTTFFSGSSNEDVVAYVEAFNEKFGHDPNLFSTVAYDGLKQLAWAVENSDGTREGIRDALADGTDIPSVVYGGFSYNDERRIDDPTYTWIEVSDGAFIESTLLGNNS
ncbi:MAG TPA: ABC transporter substrate-binding protein [Pseudoclavibacter sp.]|nr:ABC transporter substrate-binding protein [Pseudoclavibacter sp.]